MIASTTPQMATKMGNRLCIVSLYYPLFEYLFDKQFLFGIMEKIEWTGNGTIENHKSQYRNFLSQRRE